MVQPRQDAQGGPALLAQQRAQQRQTFKGQQPEEVVFHVIHPHPLWYLVSSWKLILLLCMLLGTFFAAKLLSYFGVPGWIVVPAVLVLIALHLDRWISHDLNDWIFRHYIITDWRVIDQRGFFFELRDQSALDRIQQVRVRRPNALASWFDIGDVEITTSGERSDLVFEGIHHPRRIVLEIQLAKLNRGEKHIAQLVPIRNPAVRAIIERFEEHDHPAPPPPTPARSARRRVPIQLLPNEFVVQCTRRHWIRYLFVAWPAFATAAGGIILGGALGAVDSADVGASPVALAILGLLIGGVWALGAWLNFADDILILTTHRVIYLERFFYVIAESSAETTYRNIQDIQIYIPPLGQIFRYGTLDVETAGRAANIKITFIPQPRELQDRIFARTDAAESRLERTLRRYRRFEFRRWIGTLLNDMLIEVPDVRGLPVLEATGRVRAAGLRLNVSEERYEPAEPPGRVLEQLPREGTTEMVGGEVRVVLSSQT
jgi:membrane protein YdbS with pleckstrin-like domain